jgi:hypothetical protein
VHEARKKIPRGALPVAVQECLEEQGLRWVPDAQGRLEPVGTLSSYFT